jgi:hypothetical protein
MNQQHTAMKSQNPEVDFGFYMTIPRIVRTGEAYKDLSPTQRWFYVCLKDLCGDRSTCYRTLRTLAEETGISTGMLSESIRTLHEHGLIHAEKKRRTTGGKEVWHITIVDIWQENGKAHPTKCSISEQTPLPNSVQSVNVHTVNNNSRVCSHSEDECSHSETEVIPLSNTITEVITDKIVPAFAEHNPSRAFSDEVVNAFRVLSEYGYFLPEEIVQLTKKPVLNDTTSHQRNNASLPDFPEERVAAESSVQPVEMTEGQQQESKQEASQQLLLDVSPVAIPDNAKPEHRTTHKRSEKPAKPAELKGPSKKQKHHQDIGKWYAMFNATYRELGKNEGIPANFTLPHLAQYADAFDSLIAAGATLEQGKWLLTDIWKDADPFWRKRRTPTAMAKQYAVRIGRMPRHLRVEEPAVLEVSKPIVQSPETASEATQTEGQPTRRWTRILTDKEFFLLTNFEDRKDYMAWKRAQQKRVG